MNGYAYCALSSVLRSTKLLSTMAVATKSWPISGLPKKNDISRQLAL